MPLFRRKTRNRSSSISPARYWDSRRSNFSMSARAAESISLVPIGVVRAMSGPPQLRQRTSGLPKLTNRINFWPYRVVPDSGTQELGDPEGQVEGLAGVEAGVAHALVAGVELVLEDLFGPPEALSDVVAGELEVHAARPG